MFSILTSKKNNVVKPLELDINSTEQTEAELASRIHSVETLATENTRVSSTSGDCLDL